MTNEEYVADYQSGNEEAFDSLLNENIGIIHDMVHKWWNIVSTKQATKEELEAECILGFYYATKSYNPEKGATFATHAFNKIHWHLCRVYKQVKKKTATGDDVTVISLDATVLGTDDLTVGETVADDCDIEEEVTEQVTCKTEYPKIWDAVNELDNQSRDVIYKRYKENKTLKNIASDFILSWERIRQIEIEALKTLRNMQKVKDLAETFDYECRTSYHYGMERFNNTRTSSVETVAFRHIELEEKMNSLEAELNNIFQL